MTHLTQIRNNGTPCLSVNNKIDADLHIGVVNQGLEVLSYLAHWSVNASTIVVFKYLSTDTRLPDYPKIVPNFTIYFSHKTLMDSTTLTLSQGWII